MKYNKIILIATVIIFSLSILGGSMLIANSIKNPKLSISNKGLMTQLETSEYLSLSKDRFEKLISISESERKNTGIGYDTYMFIPFVEIGEQKYFNKKQVDNWIEYKSLNK